MTERDLQLAVFNYRHRIRAFPNLITNCQHWFWESDVLYFTDAGYSHEFEIKNTHSDFMADAKKVRKHDAIRRGEGPTWFTYVCPPGVITESEVPEFAGLAYVKVVGKYYQEDPEHDLSLDFLRQPPRHKSKPLSREQRFSVMQKLVIRYWKEFRRHGYSVSLKT